MQSTGNVLEISLTGGLKIKEHLKNQYNQCIMMTATPGCEQAHPAIGFELLWMDHHGTY